jgi:hypothetical protein
MKFDLGTLIQIKDFGLIMVISEIRRESYSYVLSGYNPTKDSVEDLIISEEELLSRIEEVSNEID